MSRTKETRKPDSTTSEEREEYAGRDWFSEVTASGMEELIEIPRGAWSMSAAYGSHTKLHTAMLCGHKFAVRSELFAIELLGKGTPLDTWPISGPWPDQDRLHALVQAVVDLRGAQVWRDVLSWEDTYSFPSIEDKAFQAAYTHRLRELDSEADPCV